MRRILRTVHITHLIRGKATGCLGDWTSPHASGATRGIHTKPMRNYCVRYTHPLCTLLSVIVGYYDMHPFTATANCIARYEATQFATAETSISQRTQI